MSVEKKMDRRSMRRYWLVALFFLVFILAAGGLVFWYQQAYAQKIYPGVKVGFLDLGGLSSAEALIKLQAVESGLQRQGILFSYQDKEISINPIVITVADPDLAKPLLVFDWSAVLNSAQAVGREGNWAKKLFDQWRCLLSDCAAEVRYQIDRDEFKAVLETNFSEKQTLAKNAELKITDGQVEVVPEQAGREFTYQAALDSLEAQIRSLNFEPIVLKLIQVEPLVKKQNTGSALNSLADVLELESVKLKADSFIGEIKKEEFIPWLEFQWQNDEVVLGLNKEKILAFLQPIADQINVEARDAKFKLTGKRVTEFQSSQDGKSLDLEIGYQAINQRIANAVPGTIELPVETVPAKITTDAVNDLGIKELIGRGSSNFAGSPVNRRHNIGVGAASLNGILIEPDEEFSLLKALGTIDETSGYRRELVIKGDRTIPEFGGGLCQIGTTTFRAALGSGLPITARQNHSYRVSYYEPPVGMDATIYDPAPDFRFINDTGHYILFTARISGDDLIFEFFGTKDGRVATTTEPVAYNRISPGEPRYIETEELAPGEKKKVESAHAGLETTFTYSVIYSDGEVKEKEFKSKYVPWKETWLVGKQPTTTAEIIPPAPAQ